MPNAMDGFVARKTGWPGVPTAASGGYDTTPFRHMRAGAEPPYIYENNVGGRAMSPQQMVQYTLTQEGEDHLRTRARMPARLAQQYSTGNFGELPPGNVPVDQRVTSARNMPSGFVEWARKIGPRGLMSLFNPAGVVENRIMENTLGMNPIDAIGAATGLMSPEDKARYEQMYMEQMGT